MEPQMEDKNISISIEPGFAEKWIIIPTIWDRQHLQRPNCSSWLKRLPASRGLPLGKGCSLGSITFNQGSRATWQKGGY